MSWQFAKDQEPSHWRVDGLILVEQPSTDELLEEKRARWRRLKARRADTVRDRIRQFLKTCPSGTTVEEVAEAFETNCLLVRELIIEAKRSGWIVEAEHRTHALIRVGKVTP